MFKDLENQMINLMLLSELIMEYEGILKYTIESCINYNIVHIHLKHDLSFLLHIPLSAYYIKIFTLQKDTRECY